MAEKNLKITGPDTQEFASGETKRINAKVGNYPKNLADRFKWLVYDCMDDPSLINRHSGIFSAPHVNADTVYTVRVSAEAEPSVSRIISVKVKSTIGSQPTPDTHATTTAVPAVQTAADDQAANQQHQPAADFHGKVAEIVLFKDKFTVESGASVGIMGQIKRGQKWHKLNYVIEGVHGEVDSKSGYYTAPIVEVDTQERVKAFCFNDTTITSKFATITIKKAEPPTIFMPRTAYLMKAGGLLKIDGQQIRNWKGKNQKPKFLFSIKSGEGEINDSGIFIAPMFYKGIKTTEVEITTAEGLTDKIGVVPTTITIELKGADIPIIHPWKDNIPVDSGKKVKIQVEIRSWPKEEKVPKPKLMFDLVKGDGFVDENGVYQAEITDEGYEAEINIFTPEVLSGGATIEPIKVTVAVKKDDIAEIQPSNDLKLGAMCEIKFKTKSDFTIHPRWEIIDPAPEKGFINHMIGEYKSPEMIKNELDFQITLTDLITGKKAKPVTVKLFPISLVDKDVEAGTIRTVNAGGKPVELNVLAYYDPEGVKEKMRNYTCKIVKPYSAAGRIIDERFYEPPIAVDGKTEIEFEITSKSDKSKKIRHKLIVDFPKCKTCGGQTDVKGICMTCGEAVSYGAYLAKLKRTGGKP